MIVYAADRLAAADARADTGDPEKLVRVLATSVGALGPS